MKTEGELHDKLRGWINNCDHLFHHLLRRHDHGDAAVRSAHGGARAANNPWLFSIALVNMLAIANIPREFHQGSDWRAFLSSCAAMIALMGLFGLEIYPNLVLQPPSPANSLTIYNAASSHKTLGIMLAIALIGVPVVIAYTMSIYWIFRGKVKLDQMSY